MTLLPRGKCRASKTTNSKEMELQWLDVRLQKHSCAKLTCTASASTHPQRWCSPHGMTSPRFYREKQMVAAPATQRSLIADETDREPPSQRAPWPHKLHPEECTAWWPDSTTSETPGSFLTSRNLSLKRQQTRNLLHSCRNYLLSRISCNYYHKLKERQRD